MTITKQDELEGMQAIGRIVANTLLAMARAMQPGMTTRELDQIGRAFLDREGAVAAPEASYGFPGATCISVNKEIAHGIPGDRALAQGDLINIDVSASKGRPFRRYRGDLSVGHHAPGAGPAVSRWPPRDPDRHRTGRQRQAGGGKRLGHQAFCAGARLYADPQSGQPWRRAGAARISAGNRTWPVTADRRRIDKGLVLTIEPFLSTGGTWAEAGDDGWTLYATPCAPVEQYEHTMVATDRGAIVLTLPGQRARP